MPRVLDPVRELVAPVKVSLGEIVPPVILASTSASSVETSDSEGGRSTPEKDETMASTE